MMNFLAFSPPAYVFTRRPAWAAMSTKLTTGDLGEFPLATARRAEFCARLDPAISSQRPIERAASFVPAELIVDFLPPNLNGWQRFTQHPSIVPGLNCAILLAVNDISARNLCLTSTPLRGDTSWILYSICPAGRLSGGVSRFIFKDRKSKNFPTKVRRRWLVLTTGPSPES